MFFNLQKIIAIALLIITGWSIEHSMAEDAATLSDNHEVHSLADIDQHPCHSEDSNGMEHRHICHLGHCVITSRGPQSVVPGLLASPNYHHTNFNSDLKPSPDILLLLRPPITA